MYIISEVAEGIFQIQPKGSSLDRFPFCTVYLIIDEKIALIETGCPVQTPEVIEAVGTLVDNLDKVTYIIPTHVHPDHAGAAGHLVKSMQHAQVIACPDAAMWLSDPSIIEKMMNGFKLIFGKDAGEVFGEMTPIPKEKFRPIQYGEDISLGKRKLKAIHTPGHDPYHLCFLDTMSSGLFCGDVLGVYVSEVELVVPPYTPGTDFHTTLKSIEKLHESRSTSVFFSHGCAVDDATKYIQMAADSLVSSQNAAHEALLAGNDIKETARRIIDSLANGSQLIRDELSRYMQYAIMGAEAYRWYFKKRNMI